MTVVLQKWILRKLEMGRFSKRRDVFRFALGRSVWTTLAAVLLNLGIYQIFGRLGLLGIPLPPDPVADSVVTALVAGPICLLSFYIVGMAIYDISMSRNEFEHLSRTDPLTGLMNRRAFVEHIARLNDRDVLVVFDIDRFKNINDVHGHGIGDQILIAISGLLRQFLDTGAVARLGGEEFAAVLGGLTREEAMAKVNGLRQHFAAQVFCFGDVEVRVTFSAGVSQADGQTDYSTLLNQADKALYLAKASGRNRVVHADELAGLSIASEAVSSRRAV
jgi:diguanylate cyclase (GGDEF)-like protein